MVGKDKMRELLRHFAQYEDIVAVGGETEMMLNTTFCSIASSGYDGDDEDFEDDEDEMMWCDDDRGGMSMDGDGIQASCDMEENLDSEQMERSTPSFLSPGWLESVAKETSPLRSRSLGGGCGSGEPRLGGHRAAGRYRAVACASNGAPRRPLTEVNQNHRGANASGGTPQPQKTRFRPILDTPENILGGNT